MWFQNPPNGVGFRGIAWGQISATIQHKYSGVDKIYVIGQHVQHVCQQDKFVILITFGFSSNFPINLPTFLANYTRLLTTRGHDQPAIHAYFHKCCAPLVFNCWSPIYIKIISLRTKQYPLKKSGEQLNPTFWFDVAVFGSTCVV